MPETFTVTEDHLKLLRNAYVRYEEDSYLGAPAINQKRPYGNSDIFGDMAEILGIPIPDRYEDEDAYDRWMAANSDRLVHLHRGTATALEVVLHTGAFEPGTYERSPGRPGWKRIT